jgi:peptidoglycan/xylan/chitin deacetylase (PgdA/CDA1 family)
VPRDLSRRQFLARIGVGGSVVAAAQLGALALAGPAAARRALQPPTPTVPPVAARHALKRLLVPIPPWIRSGPTNKPRVALTIDDMWGTFGADNANAAMDVAKAKGVKLTFFPTGGALEEHIKLGRQDVWRRAVAEGHDIGNHTYTHTALTKLTDDQIRGELDHTRDLLAQCLGPDVPYTMRLMRPPGGAGGLVNGGDPRIMNVVTSLGYSMVVWTVDGNGVKGNAAFANKVMNAAGNGMIVLIHFTEFTPDGISTLIDRLRNDKKLEPTNITGLFG